MWRPAKVRMRLDSGRARDEQCIVLSSITASVKLSPRMCQCTSFLPQSRLGWPHHGSRADAPTRGFIKVTSSLGTWGDQSRRQGCSCSSHAHSKLDHCKHRQLRSRLRRIGPVQQHTGQKEHRKWSNTACTPLHRRPLWPTFTTSQSPRDLRQKTLRISIRPRMIRSAPATWQDVMVWRDICMGVDPSRSDLSQAPTLGVPRTSPSRAPFSMSPTRIPTPPEAPIMVRHCLCPADQRY